MGEVGRRSDGGVFSHSSFGTALEDGTLVLPESSPLPGTTQPHLPYVIVGDEAFPLKNYLLRPYPGRNLSGNDCTMLIMAIFYHCVLNADDRAVFNYRLSRARRIIENTFGILAARYVN